MQTEAETATPTQHAAPSTQYLAGWRKGDPVDALLTREWLVTNGLGGYASGTIGGACTRRFHGKLIAALPAPLGRTMMFNHLEESLAGDGIALMLSGDEHGGGAIHFPDVLEEFVLENGLPVWRFAGRGIRLEKRVVMPYVQNTTYIVYRLLEGPRGLTLTLRPSLNFRPHEGLLSGGMPENHQVTIDGADVEISGEPEYPPLRLALFGRNARFDRDERALEHVIYRLERSRGYEHEGPLWSPGRIRIELEPGAVAGVIASVEAWDVIHALSVADCCAAEQERRKKLVSLAGVDDPFAEQLVLAADQFLIRPTTRAADEARILAAGDQPRTVIAGYH
ncbi:MAG TPA: glycogen debranching enzyme N-terminal domain-containing protein, partial [Thermoanaerobaculia bacterium]|nr:glycogen debranching enzyme N-terminal domain-containing protein [Thermoanaerobaculia bacterium]